MRRTWLWIMLGTAISSWVVGSACSDDSAPPAAAAGSSTGGSAGSSSGGTAGQSAGGTAGTLAGGSAGKGGAGPAPSLSGARWIVPAVLPDGVETFPYSQVLSCSGCVTTPTFDLSAGALPPGLAIAASGSKESILSGAPTKAGSYQFTLRLSEGANETTTRSYTIIVLAADKGLFVDQQLAESSCTTYDAASRACGTGSRKAWKTLAGAAEVAAPGDAVLVRAGTYSETLTPKNSGTEQSPIWYSGYAGEKPQIGGNDLAPGVELSDRSYLVLQQLTVTNVNRWLYARKTHHVVLKNNTFSDAHDPGNSSKTGLFFEEATFNRIVANGLENCNEDSLALIKSDSNLVEGNTFRKAIHTLWTIKCGNRNVVRGNYFHNELEKIGEVFDCEEVGFDHQFSIYDATKRNVVEGNIFAYTPSSGDSSPYAGIQYAGQQGIVRRNLFYDMVGPGLDLTLYAEEARHTTHNRIYHNVFFGTSFAGVALSAPSEGFELTDNVFKNNVLYKSVFVANDTRWPWYTQELAGKPVQLLIAGLQGYFFEGNNLLGTAPAQPYVITQGRRDSDSNPAQHELAWWHTNHPELFVGNREEIPGFVDEAARDFRLTASSPLVDKGVFLTKTAGAGSGTTLKVVDAGYFYDGFGIPGELGDEIQLEGGTQAVRVTAVDYSTSTLTLAEPLVWTDGQGVTMRYSGTAPDLGAWER